ncbi:MFS transporter [Polymorphospora lycopeni]|uniref:MFS transporter n=1 Tax=Polymorphospora lycopeni TaxID=3140240 RepID=A0ABV5CIH8_9ACTN
MDAPEPEKRPGRLSRDADFMKFWSAESLSMMGTQISIVAIPLLAAETLDATAFQMGALNAAQFAPYLLLTLFVGVWVDRTRRLPLLIGTNLGRAVLIGLIPVIALLGGLNVWLLMVLVLLSASLTVVFDLAYQSYLPSIVERDQLVDANGRLEGSRSFAQLTGPGAAGLLVGTLTAPVAVAVNAATFLVSGVTQLFIRRVEPAPAGHDGPRPSVFAQIGHGLGLLLRNVYLRALGIEAAVYNLFNQMLWAVLILHLTRGLDLPPTVIGVVLTMSGVGALLGSTLSARLGRRWGLGPTLIVSIMIANVAPLAIPAAGGHWLLAAVVIGAALLVNAAGLVIYNIQAISLRQASVTSDVLGRTNAGYRFAVTGTAAIGAVIGGALGDLIGLRATMVVAALGTIFAVVFVIRSPIPKLRDLSEVVPKEPSPPVTPLPAAPKAG